MRNVACAFLLAAMILTLESCSSPGGSGTTPPGSAVAGSLVITLPLPALINPKSPDLTAATSYDVLGAGPGSASFQRLGITVASVTVDSLSPGAWGVTVNGNNIKGTQVKSARVNVTVASGQTSSVYASMSSSVADGSLSLTMKWPAGFSLSSVTLTPQGSALPAIALPLATDVSPVSTTIAVPAGSYTLSRVFTDKAGFISGGADAFHVTSGGVTRFDVTIDNAVSVTIVPDTSKTIPITFSGVRAKYGQGEDVSVTAALATAVDKSTSFTWYLNGVLQTDTGAAIAFAKKTLPGGEYRLDVIVSTQGVLVSDHAVFTMAGS